MDGWRVPTQEGRAGKLVTGQGAAGSDASVLPGTKTKTVAKIGPANSSGNLRFRVGGSGNSRGSTQTNLTTLPATYSAGATWSSGQMSVYLTT